VACNDPMILRHDDWICETEALNGIRNLPDLLLRMSSGVTGVGPQLIRRNIFDLQASHSTVSQFNAQPRENIEIATFGPDERSGVFS
jgi:hypothetical protein